MLRIQRSLGIAVLCCYLAGCSSYHPVQLDPDGATSSDGSAPTIDDLSPGDRVRASLIDGMVATGEFVDADTTGITIDGEIADPEPALITGTEAGEAFERRSGERRILKLAYDELRKLEWSRTNQGATLAVILVAAAFVTVLAFQIALDSSDDSYIGGR